VSLRQLFLEFTLFACLIVVTCFLADFFLRGKPDGLEGEDEGVEDVSSIPKLCKYLSCLACVALFSVSSTLLLTLT
jgi:hypothetical protein